MLGRHYNILELLYNFLYTLSLFTIIYFNNLFISYLTQVKQDQKSYFFGA